MALNVKKEQEVVKLRITKANLDGLQFQVELFPDVSGSAQSFYGRGRVMETVLQRSLAFASKVDPDGQVQITPFSDKAAPLGDFAVEGFDDIFDEFINRTRNYERENGTGVLWHGTDYATPFALSNKGRQEVVQRIKTVADSVMSGFKNLFGMGSKPTQTQTSTEKLYPRLIMFITDGENYGNDNKFMRELEIAVSDDNTFVMILGIGGGPFTLLEEADDKFAAVDFVRVPDFRSLDDEKFYDMMLSKEFVAWAQKRKG